jgi:hypothetical protein
MFFYSASFQEFDFIHVLLEIQASEIKLNFEQDWFIEISITNTRYVLEYRNH